MPALASLRPVEQENVMQQVNRPLESRVGLQAGYSVAGEQYAFFSLQGPED